MDALRHADEVLAAVWRQHPEFALPGHVGSPMDDRTTVTIPRAVIEAVEHALLDRSVDKTADATVDAEMRRAADGTPPAGLADTA